MINGCDVIDARRYYWSPEERKSALAEASSALNRESFFLVWLTVSRELIVMSWPTARDGSIGLQQVIR